MGYQKAVVCVSETGRRVCRALFGSRLPWHAKGRFRVTRRHCRNLSSVLRHVDNGNARLDLCCQTSFQAGWRIEPPGVHQASHRARPGRAAVRCESLDPNRAGSDPKEGHGLLVDDGGWRGLALTSRMCDWDAKRVRHCILLLLSSPPKNRPRCQCQFQKRCSVFSPDQALPWPRLPRTCPALPCLPLLFLSNPQEHLISYCCKGDTTWPHTLATV